MKILGFDYSMKYSNDSGYVGRCVPDELSIHVEKNMPIQRKYETIIHEVIEAVNIHNQLGLRHSTITALAVAMHQFLSDNGVNLSPLMKELK